MTARFEGLSEDGDSEDVDCHGGFGGIGLVFSGIVW